MATMTTHGMAAVANDSSFIDDAVAIALKNLGLCHVSLKEQSSAIRAIYEGHNVFVCLPTGFGKSSMLYLLLLITNSVVQDRMQLGAAL